MNHKYLILLFLPILLLNNLHAQKTNFGFDTGFGTYQMTDIKQFLENSMKTNVLQPRCVSDFPGYLFFRPYLAIEYQHLNLGIAYTLMSTGSRYSIHDYSGDYTFDTQILGNTAAVFAEIPVYSYERFKFLIAAESGIIFNKMNLNEMLQLTDMYQRQDNFNLTSINIFIKPYLKAKYEIWKGISTNILIGYHKDIIANKMHFEGDNFSTFNFIADWDGIRTSIGISYRFD